MRWGRLPRQPPESQSRMWPRVTNAPPPFGVACSTTDWTPVVKSPETGIPVRPGFAFSYVKCVGGIRSESARPRVMRRFIWVITMLLPQTGPSPSSSRLTCLSCAALPLASAHFRAPPPHTHTENLKSQTAREGREEPAGRDQTAFARNLRQKRFIRRLAFLIWDQKLLRMKTKTCHELFGCELLLPEKTKPLADGWSFSPAPSTL